MEKEFIGGLQSRELGEVRTLPFGMLGFRDLRLIGVSDGETLNKGIGGGSFT